MMGRAMVDRHCRIVDASGAAIPGLYGIGLAAGFVPWGKLGGEASFSGQAKRPVAMAERCRRDDRRSGARRCGARRRMTKLASGPTVSVIMPTYNGADLVGETIASLRAQTFGDFELIVVDDCSTDGTPDMIDAVGDPRIRVIRAPENRRVVLTRNAAFAEARGRYIAALDHDDLCHPERFARQVAYLDAHPGIVLVGTAANVLHDGAILPSGLAPLSTPPVIEWLMRIENPLVWSSVMIRADAARKLDPFQRPSRVYAEDFDLYHRISAYGGIARIDDALLTYRRHGGGASQVQAQAMGDRAADVLAEVYAPVFGDTAAATAALIVRHVMGQQPVPDRATLEAVGEALVRLQEDFLARTRPDPESRSLIRWENRAALGADRAGRLAHRRVAPGRCHVGAPGASRPRLCGDRGTDPLAPRRHRPRGTAPGETQRSLTQSRLPPAANLAMVAA